MGEEKIEITPPPQRGYKCIGCGIPMHTFAEPQFGLRDGGLVAGYDWDDDWGPTLVYVESPVVTYSYDVVRVGRAHFGDLYRDPNGYLYTWEGNDPSEEEHYEILEMVTGD